MRTNSSDTRLVKTASAQKLKDNNIVMNSILKVRHNKSSGQYCNCLLQRNQTELTTLTVYKSKKPLSESQRAKAKIWFTIVVSSSLTITKENTMTKYVFHIADGGSLTSFSSRSAYNRDSWVETLQSCNHTVPEDPNVISKGNPYGRGMYDHTGTSPFSSRKSLITPIAGPRNVVSDGMKGQLLDEKGRELEIVQDTPNSNAHFTPRQQHHHSSRQHFFKKSMSDNVKSASSLRQVEVGSHIQQKNGGVVENFTEMKLRGATSLPQTSPPSSSARLSRRQQFLAEMMVELDQSSLQKSTSSDINDCSEDEFDYVPRSTVKINRHHHQHNHNQNSVHPVCTDMTDADLCDRPISFATPASHLKYTVVDTPCVSSAPDVHFRANSSSVSVQTPTAESKFLSARLNFSAQSMKSGLMTPAYERSFDLLSQSTVDASTARHAGGQREVQTCWQPPLALPPGKNYSYLQ